MLPQSVLSSKSKRTHKFLDPSVTKVFKDGSRKQTGLDRNMCTIIPKTSDNHRSQSNATYIAGKRRTSTRSDRKMPKLIEVGPSARENFVIERNHLRWPMLRGCEFFGTRSFKIGTSGRSFQNLKKLGHVPENGDGREVCFCLYSLPFSFYHISIVLYAWWLNK